MLASVDMTDMVDMADVADIANTAKWQVKYLVKRIVRKVGLRKLKNSNFTICSMFPIIQLMKKLLVYKLLTSTSTIRS